MKKLSDEDILISKAAARECAAIRDAALMYRSLFLSETAAVEPYHHLLPDGTLQYVVEVKEQPFPIFMGVNISSDHWRKRKEDA